LSEPKIKPYRSVKLRTAARDRSCVLCQAKDGSVVPAHLPGSFYGMPAGVGQKTHDWLVGHLCFECHENMDTIWRMDAVIRMRALCLTLERLFDEGIITVQ
jgi:hypothetical protein